ncbi:hypothetical protein [Helicobacter mesocricetorum]|uniref:hypothetical protein n=1 Tax=Helicobacter mesocricetorum TaxID=87012 RepID=UPI000CF1ADA7|nr:hypothetical protein [Helicobacter mesocricetorum]
MYIDDFATNLEKIQRSVLNSEFSKHLQTYNFDTQTLSEMLVSILSEVMKTAITLKEIELKERDLALNEEKIRQELEIASSASKVNNSINLAECVKGIIQAESMLKSVNDNALINKANCYVGLLNVVGNAEQTAAIANHIPKVLSAIDAISVKDLRPYETLALSLKDEMSQQIADNNEVKQVSIYCPKLTLLPKERVRILGISTFSNNEVKFVVGNTEIMARTYDFYSDIEGSFEVKFAAKNHFNVWIEDKIIIEVRAN